MQVLLQSRRLLRQKKAQASFEKEEDEYCPYGCAAMVTPTVHNGSQER